MPKKLRSLETPALDVVDQASVAQMGGGQDDQFGFIGLGW
jgi:hypothetical protein